jgi:hypothetical protein
MVVCSIGYPEAVFVTIASNSTMDIYKRVPVPDVCIEVAGATAIEDVDVEVVCRYRYDTTD